MTRTAMRKKLDFLIVLFFLLPVACYTPKKSTIKPSVVNLSRMYNPASTRFHPAYTIYHNSPGTSLLVLKIFPVELLYSGTFEPNKVLAKVNLTYVLTDITDQDKPVMADSGQVIYTFARETAEKRFVTQVILQAKQGRFYQLMVSTRDIVRNEENLNYLYVDKTSPYSEQNFLITETESGTPVFQPNVVGNTTFKLECASFQQDTIFVRFYGKEAPLPKPSFSPGTEREFLERPDSLWVLPFKQGASYQLNYQGIYHFQLDTNRTEGLTLCNFGLSYPKVQEVEQLVEPLAYLATTTELEEIRKSANLKLAVDNFWIGKAGNIDRARELIRVYYNRVFFANFYFTSFKPGWKTDRGMIFIVYGPPQSVKVLANQEKWIYYKNNFTTTVTFNFDYRPSPFTLDNFVLQRSDSYDTYWRQAVDSWRKGNIYAID